MSNSNFLFLFERKSTRIYAIPQRAIHQRSRIVMKMRFLILVWSILPWKQIYYVEFHSSF